MNTTKERAKEILSLYISAAKKLEFIKSIILVGSLSDDTYTGNIGSDIDLIHIVSNEQEYLYEKKQILELINQIECATEKDIPIARVVFQQKHLVHPYEYDFELSADNRDLMQRPIEIFRILDSGITIYGEDLTKTIERPTRSDVVMSKRLDAQLLETLKDTEWYKGYVQMIENPTIRIMTQTVLTTALLDYYFYTGNSCSSKYHILKRIEQEVPQLSYFNLLRLCHKNRFTPDEITEQDIETMKIEYQTCFKTRTKTWES